MGGRATVLWDLSSGPLRQNYTQRGILLREERGRKAGVSGAESTLEKAWKDSLRRQGCSEDTRGPGAGAQLPNMEPRAPFTHGRGAVPGERFWCGVRLWALSVQVQ